MKDLLTLRSSALEMQMAPSQGAACHRLRYLCADKCWVDVFRASPAGQQDPFGCGSFAMVPYSNRLFDDRLLAAGRGMSASVTQAQISCNRSNVPFPIHGVGWTRAWDEMHRSPTSLKLAYTHQADAHWPYAHRAVQTVTLEASRVVFDLELHNLSVSPMPAGAGFHPFFAIEAGAILRFDASAVWAQDMQARPQQRLSVEGLEIHDFRHGRQANSIEVNHCYAGVGSTVALDRPGAGVGVKIHSCDALRHLVVYRPKDAEWVCIEPVSHATGAFSMTELHQPRHGVRELQPGELLQVRMEISMHSLG